MVKIEPGSPEHLRLISPSKVAAILGISRWESPYSLWHRMKGLGDPRGPQDIFAVGKAFEGAMGELYKLDNPTWRLSKGEVQYVSTEFGFPAVCTIDRRASRGRARRVVEFKTARHFDEWGDDGSGDCPADYASQVIAQMIFSGYRKYPAHLMVLGPFFKHFTYTLEYDEQVAKWIINECQKFYKSLNDNEPPALDDSVATYEMVRELHPDIAQGMEVDLPLELVTRAQDARYECARWETELRGAKSEILNLMGSAQYGFVADQKMCTRGPHARGGVALKIAKGQIN